MKMLGRPVGLVVLVCAFAIFAAPAMGEEFNSSTTGRTRGRNPEGAVQVWKFGPIKVSCIRAVESGEVEEGPKTTIFNKVKFNKCTTEAKIGTNPIYLRTYFRTPVDFEYHANHFAELGGSSESEVRLVTPGSIELFINAIKCTIELPSQTVPVKAEKHPELEYSSVAFSTEETETKRLRLFPSGFRKTLLIQNELKGVRWVFTQGQCSEFISTEGTGGSYIGTLLDETVGGDLSYE